MASSPQRCGEEMDATISKTLESDPRPLAYQGHVASSNDAGQGPFCDHRKFIKHLPPMIAFWGPLSGPHLGAVNCFLLRKGVQKRNLFLIVFYHLRLQQYGNGSISPKTKCDQAIQICDFVISPGTTSLARWAIVASRGRFFNGAQVAGVVVLLKN